MLIKRISLAMMALVILTTAGCGFKLQRSYSIPVELEELHLSTNDQYSELSRLVSDRLRIHTISTVPASDTTPTLRLVNDSLERATLSLYPTGNVAEYELIYLVNYSLTLPESEPQIFQTEIRRDYQDDPRTALAKSREMEMLVKEMRIQAADNIIQTLASIEVN
ncbi:LPS assembly lipoprotein LptE [Shewanella electrodiphila]|uniref:LPS-assembly lipoprotein LptE n=1 Tax=Shewanella electrodiphila TaxID=934143 RepID=A0ABT0KIW7_9GAMM|nr:LPS assembly lipoprotein LptE [Shewanella electrodiphila]MCL1043783.1 LPS assembly lipoprotein LptE [Shewanella electrodiphila]